VSSECETEDGNCEDNETGQVTGMVNRMRLMKVNKSWLLQKGKQLNKYHA
jgi:hypothetical protein